MVSWNSSVQFQMKIRGKNSRHRRVLQKYAELSHFTLLLQRTAKKCRTIYNTGARPFFYLINPFLMPSCQNMLTFPSKIDRADWIVCDFNMVFRTEVLTYSNVRVWGFPLAEPGKRLSLTCDLGRLVMAFVIVFVFLALSLTVLVNIICAGCQTMNIAHTEINVAWRSLNTKITYAL